MIQLSILVATVPPRLSVEYPTLMSDLVDQVKGRKDVEIIGLCDNFVWTVGEKRNKLLSLASGKFVSFVDDDDAISGDYIKELLDVIYEKEDIDLISFDVKMWAERLIEYEQIKERTKDGYVLLSNQAAHIYAWRKKFIGSTEFPKSSFGEDNAWCKVLLDRKPRTHHVEKFLYRYQFDPFKSETRNDAPFG